MFLFPLFLISQDLNDAYLGVCQRCLKMFSRSRSRRGPSCKEDLLLVNLLCRKYKCKSNVDELTADFDESDIDMLTKPQKNLEIIFVTIQLMPINGPNFDGSYILDFGDVLEIQTVGQNNDLARPKRLY